MRDILDKLRSIEETALNAADPKGDYQAKKKALQDLQMDPEIGKEPELRQAVMQRRAELDKEAKEKGVFEMGDAFGISFNEDFEIGTEIVGFTEDGIVIDLDDHAIQFLESQGLYFEEGYLEEAKKKTLRNTNPCWKGYHPVGTKKKGGRTVPNCVPESIELLDLSEEQIEELKRSTVKSYAVKKMDKHKTSPSTDKFNVGKDLEGLKRARERLKGEKPTSEAANPAQQAAIAIAKKKKAGVKEGFENKQQVIDYFVKRGKTAAQGAAAWERGWRGPTAKKKEVNPEKKPRTDWMSRWEKENESVGESIENAKHAPLEDYKDLYVESTNEGTILYGEDIEFPGEPGERPTGWVNFTANVDSGEIEITRTSTDTNAGNELTDYIDEDELVSELESIVEEWRERYPNWAAIDPEEGGLEVSEAKYRGKTVPLGKKLPGDVKKSKVYVRKPNGNIVKVNFGDKKMRIKKSNPKRRKSFRARHHCANPGPRWKARYWSCRSW